MPFAAISSRKSSPRSPSSAHKPEPRYGTQTEYLARSPRVPPDPISPPFKVKKSSSPLISIFSASGSLPVSGCCRGMSGHRRALGLGLHRRPHLHQTFVQGLSAGWLWNWRKLKSAAAARLPTRASPPAAASPSVNRLRDSKESGTARVLLMRRFGGRSIARALLNFFGGVPA